MNILEKKFHGKWIEILPNATTNKTGLWRIYTDPGKQIQSIIGEIKWYPPWRKYCFFPDFACVFETKCLTDIVNFINELMEERKQLKKSQS